MGSIDGFPEPDGSLTYLPEHQIDLSMCLMWVKTISRRNGINWWASNTPTGPAVTAFRLTGGVVRADAWGEGTDWALSQLPSLLGRDDKLLDFRPLTPELNAIAGRLSSLRMGSTDRWYEALATIAIGQRVVRADAQQSRTRLCRRHGTTFPRLPVAMFPPPEKLLGVSDSEFHRAGVDRSRARVVRMAAKNSERLESLGSISGADALAQLLRLPGVGPWTAGLTMSIAGGDPDAVPTGDLHLPRIVTYALSGEEGDDSRMLELLEPYRGHRMRVIRMVKSAGAGPPNRRPQPSRHDISRI